MVRDESDEGDEVGGGHVFIKLLLDVHSDVWRQYLHQRLGSQLSHRIVLDGASREICVAKEGR